MGFIFGIFRFLFKLVLALVILVLLSVGGFYLYGAYALNNLKDLEPKTIVFLDGKELEYKADSEWCVLGERSQKIIPKLGSFKPNDVFIYLGGCNLDEISKRKTYMFNIGTISVYTENEYLNSTAKQGYDICSNPNEYGLEKHQLTSNTELCISANWSGIRGLNAYTNIDGRYITTAVFTTEEELEINTRKLAELVGSYKIK